MDFRKMKFPTGSFNLVVFDPPHVLRSGRTSFLAEKYGYLKKATWRDDIARGFAECFRVLKRGGTLVFKWNECHVALEEVLALTPARPLFGNRGGKAAKTHWVVFIK
jgi:23S rRNA G2069 N7-methylase RlmK/C1962 C5-methylase RlmI